MKKFFVFIVGLFIVGTVFAVGENIPTSKTYVDNAVAQKQNTISATNGNVQVLTNTGTAGTIGTKNIYDSSAAYETQTNSLVTAGTMNTAVQNAIDSEFVCIERDAQGECLLLEIRGASMGAVLAAGYVPIEYLQGNHSGTINTGIVFNSGTLKYSIEIQSASLINDINNGLSGESDVIGNFYGGSPIPGFCGGMYCFDGCTGNQLAFFNWVTPLNLHGYGDMNQWHTMTSEFTNGTMIFSFDGQYQSIERSEYYTDAPVVLMGGSWLYYPATNNVKIRNIKIWRDGILVRNYITARDSNHVAGVYDLVNKTFTATTDGTPLTGGPDIYYMPSGQL